METSRNNLENLNVYFCSYLFYVYLSLQEDIDPPRALPALEEVAQRQHGEHDDVVDQQHVDDGREAVVAEVEPINQSLQVFILGWGEDMIWIFFFLRIQNGKIYI